MTDKTLREIDISAVFDAFAYFDDQDEGYENDTLENIMLKMQLKLEQMRNSDDEKVRRRYEEKKQYFDDIKAAVEKMPELANYRLVCQSSIATDIPKELLFACTFVSPEPDSDYYVAYRGTGDGKWVDNGEGMYKEYTVMQKSAAEYFDYVVSREQLTADDNIIVTGHSKGGNSAQYVTLASEYGYLIDSCYSLNGQGFSEKAIKEFQRDLDRYQAQIDKMYSINGENDYVHDLGFPVIPSDRTYFVPTPDGKDFGGMHGLQYMINDGGLILDPDNPWPQGPIGQFAKVLSAEMMKLNEEDLQDCALSVMSLIERFMNGGETYMEGTGDVKFATIEEFCGFIHVGIPLVLKTAITTEEGRAVLGTLAMSLINGIAESKDGGMTIIIIAAIVFACAPEIIAVGLGAVVGTAVAAWMVASSIDSVLDLFNDTLELSDVKGAFLIAKVIAKAVTFFAANPQVAVAVLTIVAVVALVTFIVLHWDDIKGFMKATGDFFVSLATAFYAWAENLVESAVNLLKSAIRIATNLYQDAKKAIADFASRLMSQAIGFFTRVSQAVIGFFGGIAKWVSSLFGSGSAALNTGNQIAVTISRIEDMKRQVGILRSACQDVEKIRGNAETVVNRVHNYYNESYVRNCTRDIQNNLRNAKKYISSAERELDRKCRVLERAVDAYYQADQNAMRDIRKVVASFA